MKKLTFYIGKYWNKDLKEVELIPSIFISKSPNNFQIHFRWLCFYFIIWKTLNK